MKMIPFFVLSVIVLTVIPINVMSDDDNVIVETNSGSVREASSESKRAVMLYIHGGGFVEGSGNDDFYGPDFFLNEDVVLVTLNYRLGVLGFLSLGTSDYSGNMGLKDQNLALNWVKDNIEQFGGDAERITIFGHSTGAASTHYHILSSESNSLFQRAILMSGSALNYWSRYVPGEHMLHMFMIAKFAGEVMRTDKDLKTFIQTVDAKFFTENVDTTITLGSVRKELELLWSPVIEVKNANKPFIQKKPEDILDNKLNNKIDTMFGFTSAELLFLIADDINNPEQLKPFDETFEIQLTRNKMDTRYDDEEYKEFTKEIRSFYFGEDVSVSNETLVEYNDLLSDLLLVFGIDQSVKAHARYSNGKSYYYRFSVEAKLMRSSLCLKRNQCPAQVMGTNYAICLGKYYLYTAEVCITSHLKCHIIDERYDNVAGDSIEMNTIRAITKLWTNFAKFGNPTPNNQPITFKPLRKDNVHFVDITNEGLIDSCTWTA